MSNDTIQCVLKCDLLLFMCKHRKYDKFYEVQINTTYARKMYNIIKVVFNTCHIGA